MLTKLTSLILAILIWEGCKHSINQGDTKSHLLGKNDFFPLSVAYAQNENSNYKWIVESTIISQKSAELSGEIRPGTTINKLLAIDLNKFGCLPGTFSIIEDIDERPNKIDLRQVIWTCSIKI